MKEITLAGLLLLATIPITSAWAFDHQKSATEAGCGICHPEGKPPAKHEEPATAPGLLKKGAGEFCYSCHQLRATDFHPMNIQVPGSTTLPLEEGRLLSCLTCHSPHSPPLASEPWIPEGSALLPAAGFKTYILTRKNREGELCAECHDRSSAGFVKAGLHSPRSFETRAFSGSSACRSCHPKIFDSWELTPHARMTRKSHEVPLVSALPPAEIGWPAERIRFVLGSHWVHRLVAEATGTLVVLPRIFDLHTRSWLPVKDYGWTKRAWLKQCAGCHTTGFSTQGDSFIEAGVGCEACHGPGRNHVRTGSPHFITNPGHLEPDRKQMVCESCHTSGLDNSGQYHFPVGYRPGEDLTRFFSGLTPKPGQDPTNFTGDESYADRRRQWDFLKSRLFLAKGLTCDYCQNFRDFSPASGSDYLSHDQYCLTCHLDRKEHPAGNPGTGCTSCHPPARTASATEYSIHDHKFSFGTPPGK